METDLFPIYTLVCRDSQADYYPSVVHLDGDSKVRPGCRENTRAHHLEDVVACPSSDEQNYETSCGQGRTADLDDHARHSTKGAVLLNRASILAHSAPAFCAYAHDACDSGTVRLADSMALAFAAVPSRIRPAIPWVIPARRKRL
jgi:hypothetical protein